MPIGIGKTTAGRSGNVPQVNITGYTREVQKRLFYSRREQALLLEKTVRGGFGNLEMGQVMTAVHGEDNKIVPYGDNGKVTVTAPSSGSTIYISAADAVKFSANEHITINDGATGVQNAQIDSIAVSGATATITTKSGFSGTFNTGDDAYIKHREGTNKYILDQDIDTGAENKEEGALGSVVFSNAVLYKDAVIGWDGDMTNFFNAVDDGVFYILR